MATLSKRVQVLFSPDQFACLHAIADARGESMGALIRKAVESTYLRQERQMRLAAVDQMAALQLPVGDWEQLERESVEA